MSKIALQPNASGSGTFTIAAPNSNSNRTLDLPDASTTLVGTDTTQTLSNKTISATTITTSSTAQFNSTIGVGNATPSASGAGITFPATQSASTNANTLDDYEEGTWTPTLTSAGGNFTTIAYGTQQGAYTKVGRIVTVRGELFTSGSITAGSASGQVYITGLPFTVSQSDIGNVWFNPDSGNYNQPTALAVGCVVTSTQLQLFKNGSVNNPAFTVSELYVGGGPGNNYFFEATYQV